MDHVRLSAKEVACKERIFQAQMSQSDVFGKLSSCDKTKDARPRLQNTLKPGKQRQPQKKVVLGWKGLTKGMAGAEVVQYCIGREK